MKKYREKLDPARLVIIGGLKITARTEISVSGPVARSLWWLVRRLLKRFVAFEVVLNLELLDPLISPGQNLYVRSPN